MMNPNMNANDKAGLKEHVDREIGRLGDSLELLLALTGFQIFKEVTKYNSIIGKSRTTLQDAEIIGPHLLPSSVYCLIAPDRSEEIMLVRGTIYKAMNARYIRELNGALFLTGRGLEVSRGIDVGRFENGIKATLQT